MRACVRACVHVICVQQKRARLGMVTAAIGDLTKHGETCVQLANRGELERQAASANQRPGRESEAAISQSEAADLTRDSAKNELGQNFPSTSAPMSKYFDCKRHSEKCSRGFYKSDSQYPERQDRLGV